MTWQDDPQVEGLQRSLVATASALSQRVFALTGKVLPPDALVSAVAHAVDKVAKRRAPALPTGPVVSLADARAAKVPVLASTFTVTIADVAQLNEIALRLHGSATDATRYAVVRDAFERGLALLADEVKLDPKS
jgi:hypothetical protein